MAIDDEKLNALIAQIYDTALDDTLWPDVVQNLALMTNASDSLLYSPRSTESDQPFMMMRLADVDANLWQTYEDYYWQHDIWLSQGLKMGTARLGNIIHGDQLVERNAFKQSELFCDCLKPMANGIGVLLTAYLFDDSIPDQPPPMFLSFYRAASADAFTSQDEGLIRYLLPHLQRALRIRWKLADKRLMRELREQALEQIAIGVMLLDDAGRLLFANRRAEELLRQSRNPTVLNGCLCGMDVYQNNAIRHALHQARQGIGSSLRLENPQPIGTRVLTFSPISATKTEQLPLPTRIMVMITEPDKPAIGDLDTFAKLYRLTTAEARVLKYLLQQLSPQEIADSLQVNIKTVRTQLSALFAKTQTKNQRELIQFCLAHPMLGTNGHGYRY